jgi:twitching motility protein PilU
MFWQRGSIAMVVRYILGDIPPLRHAEPAAGAVRSRHGEARPGADGRLDRLRQVDDAGGDDRSPQREHKSGHILTVEDPIEYLFKHKKSHRQPARDRHGHRRLGTGAEERDAPGAGLHPDRRDPRQGNDAGAIAYAQTGHLCLATLHANNSYHALNRIINFFPLESRQLLFLDLAVTLKAIVSQRLVRKPDGSACRRSKSC